MIPAKTKEVMKMISCFKGKFKLTSPRDYRVLGGNREYHPGIDLVALENKNVYAIADGTVDATPYESAGFGYYVRQKLADGRRIYYGHLAKGSVAVKQGQTIKKGDLLGVMGSTGKSTGAHTHLEIRVPGSTKQSLDICEFAGIPNKTGIYSAEKPAVEEMAQFIKNKCGFEDKTIEYLMAYKYADSLIEKLWNAMSD